MTNKNISIFFTAAVFIFLVISVLSVSCYGTGTGESKVDTDEELTDEITKIEETEEITEANLWIDSAVPDSISDELIYELNEVFDEVTLTDKKEDSDIWIEINDGGGNLKVSYVLAPVVSFFRNFDGISFEDIKEYWAGNNEALDYLSIDGSESVLIINEEVYRILEEVLGPAVNDNIKVVEAGKILENIENSNSFSIVPFEYIDKRYKVLDLDGMSVFDKKISLGNYPLAVGISVESDNPEFSSVVNEAFSDISITNRETEELASVIMTGVTAMVRQIARKIESDGVLSPGEEIAEVLKDADISHISNELPFVDGCNGTNPQGLVFCSSPEYMELLRYVGTDVIELTGNHMNDFGNEWMYYTLDIYDEEGWPYFGGGRDLEDAYSPAILESNGNKFAFLGFNWWGPVTDWATEDSPGSAPPHFEEFEAIIKELKQEGYIVIFTFQYIESYQYEPLPQQVTDFRRMADAGADIVSGSQSHHPMGVEIKDDSFINYGLGNLFFGQQLEILGNNPGIIAKHIFYKGEHINTILITTMLNDFSQPRITTPEERVKLLDSIFSGSLR